MEQLKENCQPNKAQASSRTINKQNKFMSKDFLSMYTEKHVNANTRELNFANADFQALAVTFYTRKKFKLVE